MFKRAARRCKNRVLVVDDQDRTCARPGPSRGLPRSRRYTSRRRKEDVKCRAFPGRTLHCDGPPMFPDDPHHRREPKATASKLRCEEWVENLSLHVRRHPATSIFKPISTYCASETGIGMMERD